MRKPRLNRLSKLTGLLMLFLLVSIYGVEAIAASTPALSFQASTLAVKEGEYFSITLRLENLSQNLMGFSGVIGYDPSLACLEGVAEPVGGSLLSPFLFNLPEINQEEGRVNIDAVREGSLLQEESGDLFTLNFLALKEGSFRPEYLKLQLRDTFNAPIDYLIEAGPTVEVMTLVTEDLSGNTNQSEETVDTGRSGFSTGEALAHSGSAVNSQGNEALQPETALPDQDKKPDSDIAQSTRIELVIGSRIATINRQDVSLDVAPYLFEARTFGPLRFIAESLGATVNWDPVLRKIEISRGEACLEMFVDSKLYYKNKKQHSMDVVPVITPAGRTMVPFRFVAEALDVKVDWDDKNKKVTIDLNSEQ